jgi:hypothetical protein
MIKNIIIFCIGLLILAFPLFSVGMFMDGLIYAAIADNYAQGHGEFWNLNFSATFMSNFMEHPPLAMVMESPFHWLLNGSLLSERLYSLSTWFINGWLILLIWRQLKQPRELEWFPLLMWMLVPDVIWAFSNNMLENTMGIFVSLSVLLYLKSLEKDRWKFVFLFSATICLAFLSKGFVGMYTLALPILIGVVGRKGAFVKSVVDTVLTVAIVLVLFLVLFLISPAAKDGIINYVNHQVMGSLENVQTVAFRGQIVLFFLENLILFMVLLLGGFLFMRKRKIQYNNRNFSIVRVLIVLSILG